MIQIFVYAFGPFDEYSENVTEKILRALPAIAGVHTKVFRVEFDRAMFERELRRVKPDIIIGLGQHPRARKIRIERYARNRWAARKSKPQRIESRKRAGLQMSLKIPRSEASTITYDAGTYVCNFSMYVCEQYASEQDGQAAFLHVPKTYDVKDGVRYLTGLLRELRAQSSQ